MLYRVQQVMIFIRFLPSAFLDPGPAYSPSGFLAAFLLFMLTVLATSAAAFEQVSMPLVMLALIAAADSVDGVNSEELAEAAISGFVGRIFWFRMRSTSASKAGNSRLAAPMLCKGSWSMFQALR